MKKLFSVVLSIFFTFSTIVLYAAPCTVSVSEGDFSCSGGDGAVINGQTINNTQTFWHSAGATTFANQLIVENGGTLVICGTLTLNGGINIKPTGRVIIKSGGSLTIASHTIDGFIYNFGTLNFSGDLVVNNGQVSNASATSVLNVAGNTTFNSSDDFVNLGDAFFTGNVHTNASATVCLDGGSTATINGTWGNDANNGWSAPNGASCVRYNNAANIDWTAHPLTTSTDVKLCLPTGAGTIVGQGSAVITSACTGCGPLLPIKLGAFTVKRSSENINDFIFTWNTYSEINNNYFTIEYSTDGVNFQALGIISSQGNSTSNTNYNFETDLSLSSVMYFRLKQTDFDGRYSYSKIISYYENTLSNFCAIESITKNRITITCANENAENVVVILYDISGNIIFQLYTHSSYFYIPINSKNTDLIITIEKGNLWYSELVHVGR